MFCVYNKRTGALVRKYREGWMAYQDNFMQMGWGYVVFEPAE